MNGEVPPPSAVSAGAPTPSSSSAAAGDESDEDLHDTFEWRLVDELCRLVGLRTQPTAEELSTFSRKVEALRYREVCEALEEKMQDPHWQVRLKALCGAEVLLEGSHKKGVRRWFKKHPQALVCETQSGNKAVKQRAQQCVALVFKVGGE